MTPDSGPQLEMPDPQLEPPSRDGRGERSVPIPGQVTRVRRKKSRVLQSSLDIVFSFSRSQQMRYGQIGSVPSFIAPASTPASGSPSHASRSTASRGTYGSLRHRASDPEGWPSDVDESGADEEAVNDEEEADHRRASSDPALFEADPVAGPSQTTPVVSKSARDRLEGNLRVQWSAPPVKVRRVSSDDVSPGGGTKLGSVSTGLRPPLLGGRMASPAPSIALLPGADVDLSEGVESPGTERPPSSETSKDLSPGTITVGLAPSLGSGSPDTETAPLLSPSSKQRGGPRKRRRRSSLAQPAPLGQSTDGQTVDSFLLYIPPIDNQLFNAVAVLVGIGLLSMPLAFSYAGWAVGSALLAVFGYVTCHTAKLLARIIRADGRLLGYTDIGRKAFGSWANGLISTLFCFELFGLAVALIVLFGDTLFALSPSITISGWKLVAFLIVAPTTFLPLSLLSLPSLLSSISTLLLLVIVVADGLWKAGAPGSIRDPQVTSWSPDFHGGNVLGGLGLMLAGFGGHSVMPSLARDMKHPLHFDKVVNRAFLIATLISFVAGAAGYLMFGNTVSEEVTQDLLNPEFGYPRYLNITALYLIALTPITKFALSTRPLHLTLESILHLSPAIQLVVEDAKDSSDLSSPPSSPTPRRRRRSSVWEDESGFNTSGVVFSRGERGKTILRILLRVGLTAAVVGVAIVFPGFEKVMAFLGSFSAFLICIILPIGFWLMLGETTGVRLSATAKMAYWAVLLVSGMLMVGGTAWAILPRGDE